MPKTDHRKNLTPTLIRGLKPAPAGTRYQVMDAQVPGFGVRVTDTGHRTFILRIRYHGSASSPSRREIGICDVITLTDAREKARQWRLLVGQGIDPRAQEATERAALVRQAATTFESVVEDFIRDKLPGERIGKSIEQEIRRDLLPRWKDKPITSIADMDVLEAIREKIQDGSKAAARNQLTLVKRLFKWAIAQRTYGISVSPCASLTAAAVIGDVFRARDRILTDDEIAAYWRAASRMAYPHGSVFKVLMLSGLRLREVTEAEGTEFDLRNRLWLIPASRMKGKDAGRSASRAHAVPIVDDMLAVLESLPRFDGGKYLFSTTFGATPVWHGSQLKKKLDARILRTLRALARKRGEDSRAVVLQPWVQHDIRRTVRSQLSRLRVAEEVREAVLAHARAGIKGVYDHYQYLEEKRAALELWSARLRDIVAPPPHNMRNVVRLSARP
jgi:integrase